MTLAAAILLLGIFPLTSIDSGLIAQSTGSSGSPSPGSAVVTQEPTSQNPAPAAAAKPNSDQTSASKSPAKQSQRTGKHTRRKKHAIPANCEPAPANSTGTGTPSSTGPGAQPQAAGTQEPSKNCPPAKIVVRQGGISEQSIQLAGGSAGEAAQKRDAANQMLAATEENLKKISGRQLSSDQQGSASQIRQFVNQSKSALAAGDLERAQTLAWKAKLLSEDLVNPGK